MKLSGPNGAARRIYEAVVAELARAGVTPGPLEHGAKHYRLPVTINGREHKITLPGTPRDSVNGVRIKLGDVRRLLRSEGIAP